VRLAIAMILLVQICVALIAGGIAIAIAWLMLGRRISFWLDKCVPGRRSAMPHDPSRIKFDPEGLSSHFTLGSTGWSLSWPERPWPSELKVLTDRQCRLVLRADAHSFTFGPVATWWNDPVKPEYQFVAEAGDVVSFTREISRVPWPTPFEYSILGGSSPKWKKFAYDRLRWRKASGSVLEVVWRSEYWFYRKSGWADNWQRRLTGVSIRRGPIEKAIAAYLARTKGWTGAEYRLESLPGSSAEALVAAVHLDDGTAIQPGCGKSVVLHVNKASGKVVGETGFQ
jgi:hypothetical protein